MSSITIGLVLLSALFHALRSLFTKESGDKQISGAELLAPVKSIAHDHSTRLAFLKEKHQGIRLTGALIIFAGGFLISLAK